MHFSALFFDGCAFPFGVFRLLLSLRLCLAVRAVFRPVAGRVKELPANGAALAAAAMKNLRLQRAGLGVL